MSDIGRRDVFRAAVVTGAAAAGSAAVAAGRQGNPDPCPACGQPGVADITAFDFMSSAERAAVSAYSFALDVTAAVNAAVNHAYRKALRLRFPPGGYRVSQILLPDDPAIDPRSFGFEMVGAGHGEGFAYGQPRGTVIRGADPTLSTLKFQQTAPRFGSGTLLIHQIRFEGAQHRGIAVVDLEALYATSRFYDCDIYQSGPGDGLSVGQMAAAEVANCFVLSGHPVGGEPSWLVPGNVARVGTGVLLRSDLNCGLASFHKVTSRGWDLGFDLGDPANEVTLFSTRLTACEGSNNRRQLWIRKRQWKTVVESCYFETSHSDYAILNDGNHTTIANCDIGIDHQICIDDSSTSNIGTVITGNNIQMTQAGPCIGIVIGSSAVSGGPGKLVSGNSFSWSGSGGAVANVRAVQIDGIDPRIELSGNAFSPRGPWVGGVGTTKIQDNSQIAGSTALYSQFGLGTVQNGRQEFPLLGQGLLSLGIPEAVLGDGEVKRGVLAVSRASYSVLTLSRAARISGFDKMTFGQMFILFVTNGKATFVHGANLKLAGSVSYTPPGKGALMSFICTGQSGGVALCREFARVEL